MIYYFSGSGNSRYAAQTIGSLLGECVERAGSASIVPATSVGFILPVYAWGIPPHVLKWIERTGQSMQNPEYIWAILTYGDEAGMAHHMLRRSLLRCGLTLDAVFGLQMPNTYVLLPGFDVDPIQLAIDKLANAGIRLEKIAGFIKDRERKEDLVTGQMAWLKTGIVYPLFKVAGIQPARWHCDDQSCIGCSLCARSCPVNNIRMVDNRPVWGKHCTSCLGCYHSCPKHAVLYGGSTTSKGQWRHWFASADKQR